MNSASNNTNVDVVLSASALAFLNSMIGSTAAVGGALTSINYANTTVPERLFNSSSGTMTRQLILTTVDSVPVPEPGTLTLLATGVLVMARRARVARRTSV